MARTLVTTSLAVLSLAACATPGVEYDARIMPENADAAATRYVSIGGFSGPASGWYESRFEAMLGNATFDGEPWFRLAGYMDPEADTANEPSGIYSGDIRVVDYHTYEETRFEKKCIEWDGLFDCETRAEVELICLHEEVEVEVSPFLVSRQTGQTLFSGSYGGESSEENCEETGYIVGHKGKPGRHGFGHYSSGFRGFGGRPPRHMIESALLETLPQIRRDIAPRNARVKVDFVADAIDPVAKADPLFEQAIKASRNDAGVSCMMFLSLAEAYPEAPAVLYNQAVCSQAEGRFSDAHGQFAQAAEYSANFNTKGTGPLKKFREALENLSYERQGLEIIEDLSDQWDGFMPVPIDDEQALPLQEPDQTPEADS